MKFKSLATAACLTACVLAQPASAGWIDWTSTTTGTMTIGATSVGVTLTGNPLDQLNGDHYYNNGFTGGTSASGTYAGLAPSDLIRINNRGTFTLNFDQTVSDLYMALVSVGQGGLPVNYAFSDSFSVISSGNNYWGYTGYSVSGNNFTGREYNGVLHFAGDFNSISFDTDPNEYWHGFNFASFDTASSVSEPAPFALLGLGLIGLAAVRRRKA
jgi:hypothetical protein